MRYLFDLFFALYLVSCSKPKCDVDAINSLVIDVDLSRGDDAFQALDSLGDCSCANAVTYIRISNKYLETEQYKKAIQWGLKSIHSPDGKEIRSFIILSDAYRFLNMADSALAYIDMGAHHCAKDSVFNDTYLSFRKGQVCFEQKMFVQSLEYFQQSIESYKTRPAKLISLNALHDWVYSNLLQLNETEKACDYAKLHLPDVYEKSYCQKKIRAGT
jgi:tetratricopeptide (TPR) repeat protein